MKIKNISDIIRILNYWFETNVIRSIKLIEIQIKKEYISRFLWIWR